MMLTANMMGWRETVVVIGKKQRGVTSLLTYLWDRIVNFLSVALCLSLTQSELHGAAPLFSHFLSGVVKSVSKK